MAESRSRDKSLVPFGDSYRGRLALLCALALPAAYSGVILGVSAHEILGHGLTAMVLGGEFYGFTLSWDGMGSAYTSTRDGAPASHRIVVLSGGIVVTTVIGAILLALASARKGRPLWSAGAAVLAACVLLDGAPYLLWSALLPEPDVGDPARIVRIFGSEAVRWVLVGIGAALTLLSVFLPTRVFFRSAEQFLAPSAPLTKRQRAVAATLLIGLPGSVGELSFDWSQLVPASGRWPSVFGACLWISPAVWLARRPPTATRVRVPATASLVPIVGWWTVTALLVTALVLWFHDGVFWS